MDAPAYESPLKIGDNATVYGTIAVDYDVGGTCLVEHDGSGVEVKVTTAFWDYETGWIFHGVVSGPVLDEIRRQATSGFTAEDYRQYEANNPGIVEQTMEALRKFDPSKLKFSEHDLKPPAPRPR